MKKSEGNAFYLFMMLCGVAVTVLATDLLRHLWLYRSSSVPLHSHVTGAQAAIVLFCCLFYLADRFKLYHLSLRLCFLSLFLVAAKILFDMQTGRFNANTVEIALLFFVGIVMVGLSRHPIRMLEKRKLPS